VATRKTVARVEETETAEAHGTQPAKRALSPSRCRTHLRRELGRQFEQIVQGFVEQAKTGSCQHLKLATELLEIEPEPKDQRKSRRKRGPGPVAAFLQQMQQTSTPGTDGMSDGREPERARQV
jgi:hypothetical protein